jgi:hypothetical protein
MPIIYPSQGLFPRWKNWLIDFTDLTDEFVKKLGDTILCGKPDPTLLTISANSSTVVTDKACLYPSIVNDPTVTVAGQLTIKNNNTTQAISVSHKNYYYNTARALINLAQSKGVDESQLNAVTPPHYNVIQWMIEYLSEQVCIDNIALNVNAETYVNVCEKMAKAHHDKLIGFQGKINYETFNTAAMQQNFTMATSRTFDIIN